MVVRRRMRGCAVAQYIYPLFAFVSSRFSFTFCIDGWWMGMGTEKVEFVLFRIHISHLLVFSQLSIYILPIVFRYAVGFAGGKEVVFKTVLGRAESQNA